MSAPVLRAFSVSAAAHALLILSLLALSTAPSAVRIAEIPRSVRLVATLEPAPAAPAPSRPARIQEPPPARPAPPPPRPAPRPEPYARSVARQEAPAPAPTPSRILIPEPGARAPAPPRPEPRPALEDRLRRHLAAAPAPTAAPAPELPRVPAPPPSAPSPELPRAPAPPRPAASAIPAVPPGQILPLADFPHAWYLALLKDRIFARWVTPSDFYLGGRDASALVSFRVERAGRISRLSLREGSGYRLFDQSALAAVQGLDQIPPLPQEYKEESLDVVIRFQSQR